MDALQHITGLVRKAVQDYEMIAPGDRILVGVSGGKDSVVLTVALARLRAYLGVPFTLQAVTLDPCFGGVETDYGPLLATESEVSSAVRRAGLPVIKSRCPADGVTVREETKQFVREASRKDPAFRQKTLHALQQSGIDGWRPLHTGRKKEWAP